MDRPRSSHFPPEELPAKQAEAPISLSRQPLVAAPPAAPADSEPALGRRALRKASLHLLPLLGLAYGVAYMDRANVSYAALQMNHDLHFSASIYGLGAGLFFIGYSVFEVPSNLLLVRYGARRWLARIMFTWGLLAAAMMLVRTPLQFYAMRFVLGIAEAGFFPGLIFYLTQWFPAQERARSISRFYVALPLSSVLMGAVAGALLHLDGRLGLAGWQWLFLLEGLPAVVFGAVFLLRLPNGPADARWLTAEERQWLLSRIQQEQAAVAATHDDSWRALMREPRFWLMTAIYFCSMLSMYSYNLSAPTILQQLTRLTPTRVGFLLSATNLIGAFAMIVVSRRSDRTGERFFHVAVPFALVALGFLLAGLSIRSPLGVWIGVPALSLVIIAFTASLAVLWTIPPKFLSGRSSAAGIALINSIGMLGAFAGPYGMGLVHDLTGSYQLPLLLCTVPALGVVVLTLAIRRMSRPSATPSGTAEAP
jgi:ACS family tartrate transporter-like MFS transporter